VRSDLVSAIYLSRHPAPNPPPFGFPVIERKKVVAAFDGGRISSDGGVLLLGAMERQLGIADTLAPLISDPRNPLYVTHSALRPLAS
jgi:hypothetical protein